MSIYTIADLHLSLADRAKRMDVFGGRWLNYTEKIKSGWCAVVTADDTVVVGGDISWGMSLEACREDFMFIESLPGRKIFLEGNHDYWWTSVRKMEDFCRANSLSFSFMRNNAFCIENTVLCGSRGWYTDEKSIPSSCADSVKLVARECARLGASLEAGRALRPDTVPVAFLHFPPVFGSYVCEELVSVLERYCVKRCYIGHIHGKYDTPASFSYRGICFIRNSADFLSFTPIKL